MSVEWKSSNWSCVDLRRIYTSYVPLVLGSIPSKKPKACPLFRGTLSTASWTLVNCSYSTNTKCNKVAAAYGSSLPIWRTAKGGWYRFKIEMYRNDQFPLTVSSVHSHPFPIRFPDRSTALPVAKTSSVIGQPLGTRVIKHVTEIAMSVYDSICPSYFQSCYVTLYICWNSLPKRQPFGRNFKDASGFKVSCPHEFLSSSTSPYQTLRPFTTRFRVRRTTEAMHRRGDEKQRAGDTHVVGDAADNHSKPLPAWWVANC